MNEDKKEKIRTTVCIALILLFMFVRMESNNFKGKEEMGALFEARHSYFCYKSGTAVSNRTKCIPVEARIQFFASWDKEEKTRTYYVDSISWHIASEQEPLTAECTFDWSSSEVPKGTFIVFDRFGTQWTITLD